MTTIARTSLLRIANLVKPTLANAAYIPAYTHILFANGRALTHNDIAGLSVKASIGVDRCVPGDLLIKSLASFSGEQVAMTYNPDTSVLLVSSGRAKLSLPTLPPSSFPFEMPNDAGHDILITKDMLKGIEHCLMSVGKDDKHPSAMGVTMDTSEGAACVMYSTDNYTISRYATSSAIDLPGNTPVILPTFFCEQLLMLSRAWPGESVLLFLLPGALVAEVGDEAVLFHKMLVDTSPLDFARVVERVCDPDNVKVQPVPLSMDSAISRALLVVNSDSKRTKFYVGDDKVQLKSESKMADAEDEMDFKTEGRDRVIFSTDPSLVARALKHCSHISFSSKAVLLTDGDSFLHIIAHMGS